MPLRLAVSCALSITRRETIRILEIGYNLGHSSSVFIANTQVTSVASMDNSPVAWEAHCRNPLPSLTFIRGDSADDAVWDQVRSLGQFDMAFIDGDHSVAGVANDVRRCLDLKIPLLLFDDIIPHWGPGVWPAIVANNLHVHAIFGNMALCESKVGWVKVD